MVAAATSPKTAKNLPLFNGIDEAEIDALLKEGRLRKISKGQMLFLHGDPVTHFYVLVSGTLQLFRETADGEEKTLNILKGPQTLCEDELFSQSNMHQMSAVAVEEVNLLEFPITWLRDKAKKNNTIALNLITQLSKRTQLAELEAEHLATMTAPQLVACYLQRICVLYDFNPKGFTLPYSKSLIASRLGMELETFSRTLAKLKNVGINIEGNQVSIHNMDSLEEFVCHSCSVAAECQTLAEMQKKLPARRAIASTTDPI